MRRPYKNTRLYKQIKHELKFLYIEYKKLNAQKNKTMEEIHKLEILITKISIKEAKFISQLKQRYKQN